MANSGAVSLGSPITGWCRQAVRQFGGRAGGLKKKKKKKEPRVMQTGLGKRMEFFWPKHHKVTRVPMYQNVRPNLVFDQHLRRWMVMWYRAGIQVFRPFTCKKQGFEKARTKAIILMKQLASSGVLRRPPKPEKCRSGVRGVYFDPEERLWVAVWGEAGIRRFRAFSVLDMGFDEAYKAAVAVRKQKLADNHQFVMQRSRNRSGRNPLK